MSEEFGWFDVDLGTTFFVGETVQQAWERQLRSIHELDQLEAEIEQILLNHRRLDD